MVDQRWEMFEISRWYVKTSSGVIRVKYIWNNDFEFWLKAIHFGDGVLLFAGYIDTRAQTLLIFLIDP